MSTPRTSQFWRGLVGTALFAVLLAAIVVGFLWAFAPARPPLRLPVYDGYDREAIDRALSAQNVSNELARILACGSRFEGQAGFVQARELVRAAYTNAGLSVLELSRKTLAPRTVRREIADAAGQPLEGVEVYPFAPNHFQPIVTPDAGVSGTLVLMTDEVLRTRARFDDAIAVIDVADPPISYGRSWAPYAQAGFKAVILAHRDGLEAARWTNIGSNRGNVPVNYPRLAATAGIFRHLGETVRVTVQVMWEDVDDTTLIGFMPGLKSASEAVVVAASYDAPSALPDLAPGTLSAVSLAAQLALLRGCGAYRDDAQRERDLVFVACGSQSMGLSAVDALTRTIGPAWDRESARRRIANALSVNAAETQSVEACRRAAATPGFLDDPRATDAAVKAMAKADRAFFEAQLRYTLNSVVLESSEKQLQARLAFLREGGTNTASTAFVRYRDSKRDYDEALTCAGLPVRKLLAEEAPRAFVLRADVRRRVARRLEELAAFHISRERMNRQEMAVHEAFRRYTSVITVVPFLAPGDPSKTKGESITFGMGPAAEVYALRQSPVINDTILAVVQQAGLKDLRYDSLRGRSHNGWAHSITAFIPAPAGPWNGNGHPAFMLMHSDRGYAYEQYGVPVDLPAMHNVASMALSLRALGRITLALVYGNGAFEPPLEGVLSTYDGRVYLSNVGRSIVPNYPLAGALVGHKGTQYSQRGYNEAPFVLTDPYGRYALPASTLSFMGGMGAYSPEAVGFGPDGLIRYVKDEGPQGQRVYKSINVGSWGDRSDVNIVTFRATPVTLFDMINPQNLKAYTGIEFLRQEGLASAAKFNQFSTDGGMVTSFLEPDLSFFVTLKAGSPDNEQVQTIRAFLLGVDSEFTSNPDREIDGRGHLAADYPFLLEVPRDAAYSMLLVNGKRMELQVRYNMADERVLAFHERSRTLVERAETPDVSRYAADRDQRAAVTYATLNHPVLRRTISEAVVGIIWYLGLLVPFVFFFEKLAFGFADIRRQLAAQTAIFLAVFILLRLLHPAFAMVRSSVMILLGFIIMLISGGITLLFSGKFKENLEDLRRKRGQATAADVNAMGIMGTAFTLGLNNMHRRIVRTGLTCATLVLLTFAMICFTSVQSDVVDSIVAVGRAPYQGMLIKGQKFTPISDSELFALKTRYGYTAKIATRRMLVGAQGWDQINRNPGVEAVYEPAHGTPLRKPVTSILEFGPDEPLRHRIPLIAGDGWFTLEMVKTELDVPPVLVADELANSLGIRAGGLAGGEPVLIKVNGKQLRVHGIFDSAALAALRDIDGRDVLPFDLEAMRTVEIVGGHALAEETDPRLRTGGMLIVPDNVGIGGVAGGFRLTSVALCLPDRSYKQAREEIEQYLEQSGNATYYGLGGVAYRGKRARERSFAGMMEMLIPLIIAAMTVLNTMRGSVYERRDEIFVYNAVGIAPRYIFAMFFSEAFVYAIVGSILGFLLSQGVGRTLTALGWTGGLNMTFTSINTIYASLAIMAAVFISTFFPARSAMEIAAPAEESGWKLPEPEGDTMDFALPFTFSARDRVAVLAFFRRYFLDHGEGSAGQFFAGEPRIEAIEGQGLDARSCVPMCEVTVWLKPFDLGVSQQLRIVMPTDPETHEFLARVTLTRLSATRESWLRLNGPFVTFIRRHFLYWRAVSPAERDALFAEARRLLGESVVVEEENSHA
jgi:hypothetical protein